MLPHSLAPWGKCFLRQWCRRTTVAATSMAALCGARIGESCLRFDGTVGAYGGYATTADAAPRALRGRRSVGGTALTLTIVCLSRFRQRWPGCQPRRSCSWPAARCRPSLPPRTSRSCRRWCCCSRTHWWSDHGHRACNRPGLDRRLTLGAAVAPTDASALSPMRAVPARWVSAGRLDPG